MSNHIPPLNSSIYAQVEALMQSPTVAKALQIAVDETEFSMQEQVDICEIPAPTFEEQVRAQEMLKRMKAYGLKDVQIDEIGNVIGFRAGKGQGPVLAIGAHMDTVFPAGTDVTVRQEGHRYYAPGIGDNCSGLRAFLQVIRSLNEANVETEGDLYFVATVGEEGLGDIRGAKHFVAHHQIDGFIAIDNTDIGRILRGAVESRRYRMTIVGPGGHSYSEFGVVGSAIHAMCLAGAKVAHIKTIENPRTTYTLGTIKGGTSVNTVAPSCEVEVDMRSLDPQLLSNLEKQIIQCFEDGVKEENELWNITNPDYQVKLIKTPIGDRPAGLRPENCPVLQASRSALKALGLELTNYGLSSTDANAALGLGLPATCLSSGGFQDKCHTVNEYFDKVNIHQGPQLLILTAVALVGTDGFKPILNQSVKH